MIYIISVSFLNGSKGLSAYWFKLFQFALSKLFNVYSTLNAYSK